MRIAYLKQGLPWLWLVLAGSAFGQPPTITPSTGSTLPAGTVNIAYNQNLTVSGGVAPYTWSVAPTLIAGGITIAPNGNGSTATLSGSPTVPVSGLSITVSVQDSSTPTPLTASATYTLTVGAASTPLTITPPPSLPRGMVGASYSTGAYTAAGGSGSGYQFSVSSGNLPPELVLDPPTGVILGNPNTPGTYTFVVRVRDSNNATAETASQSITIDPSLTLAAATLPEGTVGVPYAGATLQASGGSGGYSYVLTGTPPPGLTLSPGGVLSGTPTTASTYSFGATVTDSAGRTASQAYSIVVGSALSIVTTTLPGGTVGLLYSAALEASGGSGNRTWSATGLPAGLQLAPTTGIVSGTPQTADNYTVNVTVTDSTGSRTRQFPLTISAGLTITTTALPTGAVGLLYNAPLEASGGSGTRTWSATGLPSNLVIGSTSGVISGTPQTAETYQVSVTVTDSTGPHTQQFPLTISEGLTITTSSLPAGVAGSPYSVTLTAANASGALNWTATGLPTGLQLAPTTGIVSGTPQTAGVYTVNVMVSASGGGTASRSLSLTITAGLSITTTALPAGVVGQAYSATLTATGGTAPYEWAVTTGVLPPDLKLTGGTGIIAGTPTTAIGSPFTVTIKVKDAANVEVTAPFTIAITSGLTIVTTSLPAATIGTPYTANLSASGGSGTGYTWSLASGALPAGLMLQPSGVISGTPTGGGQTAFSVRVTDSASHTATANLQITTSGSATVNVVTTSLPAGSAGVAYSATLQASGGSNNYLWLLTAGLLPPGLTMGTNGIISGVPTTGGTFSFTVRAADAQNPSVFAERALTLAITGGVTITTATLPTGAVGSAYGSALQANGGTLPYTWSQLSGQLPLGLGLSPTGLLSGTPAVPGVYSFTARVLDGAGATATRLLSLTVNPAITITNSALPGGSVGVAYAAQLTATGGTGTGFTWTVASGSLPPGLSLNPVNGQISGSPTANGATQLTMQVTDSGGASTTRPFTITIASALSITTTSLPAAATGNPYGQTFTAAGGTPPLTWSVTAGTLPPGLQLEPTTGLLNGSPTASGSYTFTIQARDNGGTTATRPFTLQVNEGLTITTTTLRAATEGSSYSETLQATGGAAPYTWSLVVADTLPPGVTLAANGTISGTPRNVATYGFLVSVRDASQQTVTKAFTLIVNARTSITITTPQTLPQVRELASYSQQLQATGGVGPYAWTLAQDSPALPVGLSLSAAGLLTGAPSTPGVYNFNVRVSDSTGATSSQSFSLTVTASLHVTTGQALTPAVAGTSYTAALAAEGGQPGYTWTLSGGNLPAGLSLSAAGTISGTPTTAGTFNFSARVVDAAQADATASFTLVVRLPSTPLLSFTGLGETASPAQQPPINLQLGAPFPAELRGVVTLTFASDAVAPADDPAVVFANGQRTVAFVIPAGSTTAQFPGNDGILQTGTVAGVITLTASLEAGGQNVTPNPAPRMTTRIASQAPVLRTVRARRVSGGLEVDLVGFSPSRELRSATFRFTPIPGSALQTTELTVQLETSAKAWYEGEASRAYGSQFTMTQRFNVQGDTNAIGSVTVTLRNAQGDSAAATANF